jgi:hypothetical protein
VTKFTSPGGDSGQKESTGSPDGKSASGTGEERAGGKAGGVGGQGTLQNQTEAKTELDYATLIAGVVNLEVADKEGVISGGIPGGHGSKENKSEAAQSLYVALAALDVVSVLKALWSIGKAVVKKGSEAVVERLAAKAVAKKAAGPLGEEAATSAVKSGLRIVEESEGVVEIAGNIGEHEVSVLANISREGETLYLKQAHIQGPGPGKVGIKALFDAISEFGKSQGVKRVVIEGAKRTTGAGNQRGAVPRAWNIAVK